MVQLVRIDLIAQQVTLSLSQSIRSLTGVATNTARKLFQTTRNYIERSRQRRQLARLDLRALQDIGVSRSEALVEANKPFWKA